MTNQQAQVQEKAAQRKIPAPISNPETQAFWNAAAEGKFLIRKCQDCGKAHWYPRAICPFCFSANTEWVEGSGKGTVYSYSVMRHAAESYVIAYVTLDEGPTMMTNIVECEVDAVRIGQKVALVFMPTDGGPPAPMFKPI